MPHTIALVGRTNVGKSTLFNKLIEKNQALTSNQPNTTRDRNYGEIVWRGEIIKVVDTGGLDAFDFVDDAPPPPTTTTPPTPPIRGDDVALPPAAPHSPLIGGVGGVVVVGGGIGNTIEHQILEQTHKSFQEADLIIFVIDSREGILPQEKKLTKLLQTTNKPIILVANKVDSNKIEQNIDINELIKLNFGEPHLISAKSGRGTGDLLDHIFEKLKSIKKTKSKKAKLAAQITPIKIALIGKPNVGKSSILNTLLDKKYAIVSPIEHTTREPQDITFTYKKQPFTIIDTAGIRKKANIKKGIENFGVQRSLDALEESNVAILVIDVSKKLTVQDNYLADQIRKSGAGLIIVANKWDLISNKETNTINEYTDAFYHRFPYLKWAPIIFTSALTKIRVKNILDMTMEINIEKDKTIGTQKLKDFTKKFIAYHKPSRGKGILRPRVKDFFQTGTNPPTFVLELYPGADLHKSYFKYITNQLRKTFGFTGVPIRIKMEAPKAKHGVRKK